jgi:RNA polymerase sigma factor (TIGR02999 family)
VPAEKQDEKGSGKLDITGLNDVQARQLDAPTTIGANLLGFRRCRTLPGAVVESRLSSLMDAAEHGDGPAANELFSALYAELHRLARRQLAGQGASVTLGATTLLHQAYIEMAAKDGAAFPDRARFMGYAARVMRGIIIDHARARSAQKRGGQFHITSAGAALEHPADDRELTRISEALDELAKADPSLAEIVDLKFFCGFTFAEIAATKGICERTAQREWEKARIYLHRSIRADLEA